jgi:hypothetical protein
MEQVGCSYSWNQHKPALSLIAPLQPQAAWRTKVFSLATPNQQDRASYRICTENTCKHHQAQTKGNSTQHRHSLPGTGYHYTGLLAGFCEPCRALDAISSRSLTSAEQCGVYLSQLKRSETCSAQARRKQNALPVCLRRSCHSVVHFPPAAGLRTEGLC